jgi:hypothetical protein
MVADDELDAARRRFPLGDTVTGRVAHIPRPGAIGLLVDLGGSPTGFVDVLLLPRRTADWPEVGAVATFEVCQHRPGQVRLCPLGGGIPAARPRRPWTDRQWAAVRARHPVGSEATATVTSVTGANREYGLRFDDCTGVAEWRRDEPGPAVGTSHRYRVLRHLDSFGVAVVAPVAGQATGASPASGSPAG